MNNEHLFEALNGADDALLARAEAAGGKCVRVRFGKTAKILLAAAALLAVLAVSAAAAYRFFPPRGLEETLNLASPRITAVIDTDAATADTVTIENRTVKTAGYTVTFEALAQGICMHDIYENGEFVHPDRTYAIFTVTRDDGKKVMDFDAMTGADIGYLVSLKGYNPNASMFHGDFTFYDAGETLYLACDVSRALVFADRELTISVVGSFAPNNEIIRMDENGDPYFVESWKGLAAMFELRLDQSQASVEAQQKYMQENPCFIEDPDYTESDKVLARREKLQSGEIDYTAYIGDNKWEDWFLMEFGQVDFADEYLARRGDWAKEGMQPLTLEKLEDVLLPAMDDIFNAGRAEGLSDGEIQARVDAATVSADAFPATPDRFTLPDGSVCFYMRDDVFVRVRPDGVPCFVIAACAHVIIEVEGINNWWATQDAVNPNNWGVNGAQLVAARIDGRDPLTVPHGEMTDGELLQLYEADSRVIRTREDAVWNYVSNFAGYPGTAEVRD